MKLSDLLAGEPVWITGTTYAAGKVVRSPANFYMKYVRVVAGAGATDPASDSTNWRPDGSTVRSIQRGLVQIPGGATSAVVTISAVNADKTELRYLGGLDVDTSSYTSIAVVVPNLYLTNSTTITITRHVARSGPSQNISWELTEYY